jgi:hypothetical protein
MSGGWTLVTQPEGNDGDIDAGLKEMHGRRMTEGMWRDPSFFKRRESFSSFFYSQTKSVFNT